MPDREGPTLVTPDPYYVCKGCPHLRIDRNNYVCGNPKSPFVLIGMTDDMPGWCPLLPREDEK